MNWDSNLWLQLLVFEEFGLGLLELPILPGQVLIQDPDGLEKVGRVGLGGQGIRKYLLVVGLNPGVK